MSKSNTQYTVIREYKNYVRGYDLVKKIIHSHMRNDLDGNSRIEEHSKNEVKNNGNSR